MKRLSYLVSLVVFASPLACRVERVKDKAQVQAAEATKAEAKSYDPIEKIELGDWPLREAANELDACVINPPAQTSSAQDLCTCLIEYAAKTCSYDQFVEDRSTYLAAGVSSGNCQ